jgi:hypothetical protein
VVAGRALRCHFQEHALAGTAVLGLGRGRALELPARAVDEAQRQARGLLAFAQLHGPLLGRGQDAGHLLLQRHQLVVVAGHQRAGGALRGDAVSFGAVARGHHVAQVLDGQALVGEVQLQRLLARTGSQEPALVLAALGSEGLAQVPVVGGQRPGIAGRARGRRLRLAGGIGLAAVVEVAAGAQAHGDDQGQAPGPAWLHVFSLVE